MKRTLGTLSVLALFAAPSLAGDYHNGANLVCGDCHVMHYSQQHDYDGGAYSGITLTGGPFEYLLRDDVNNLCLSCHGGTDNGNTATGPDVYTTNAGKYPTQVRSAGALNSDGATINGYDDWMGHSLGSTDQAPGSTWNNPDGLTCTNCHEKHGDSNYKNLKQNPGTGTGLTVTYATSATFPGNTTDVWQNPAVTFSYDQSEINWLEPSQSASAIADWCGGCHTNFHGAVTGTEIGGVVNGTSGIQFIRHPAGGVDIGGAVAAGHSTLAAYTGAAGKINFVKVMSATGVYGKSAPATITVTCISCHKGHGNLNPFGLIYMKGDGVTVTEQGDSTGTRVENLCAQCHTQASAFAP